MVSYWIGTRLEKRLKVHLPKQKQPVGIELIRHKMFTMCTALIFNIFFMFGARPNLHLLPIALEHLFTVAVAITSGLWLHRTWERTPALYKPERLAGRLREQLRKLNLNVGKFLEGRSLDELTAEEIYVLAKILPDFSQEKQLQGYQEILKEAIENGYVEPASSLSHFKQRRRELNISDRDHETILISLGQKYPTLFYSQQPYLRQENKRHLGGIEVNIRGLNKAITPQ